LSSVTICCTGCNNAIGRSENDLCSALREASAALGTRDADNHPITAEIEANGKKYAYSDGMGVERMPPLKHEAGALVFPLPGGSDEQASAIAKRLWNAGLTPRALDDGKLRIEPDNTFHIRPHPPRSAVLNWVAVLGTTEHMRVVMKMALELLAYVRSDDARRWGVLRTARRYIRWSEDDGTLPVRFDALSHGSGLFREADLPQLAHAVEVWTHRRNLHFRVTLFGGLHITGSLTTQWDGPPFTVAHALDPTQPRLRTDRRTESDGPPLGVYHVGLKQQALDTFAAWFLDRTKEVSARAALRPWEPPVTPDLIQLRPLIEKEYAALLNRKRQPRKKTH
jgi:hypothetical protein